MTQNEIIEMAREADGQVTMWVNHSTIQKTTTFTFESPIDYRVSGDYPEMYHIKFLERFAKLVAAKEQKKWQDQTEVEIHEAVFEEREACAKECEYIAQESDSFTESILRATATQIRARGEA